MKQIVNTNWMTSGLSVLILLLSGVGAASYLKERRTSIEPQEVKQVSQTVIISNPVDSLDQATENRQQSGSLTLKDSDPTADSCTIFGYLLSLLFLGGTLFLLLRSRKRLLTAETALQQANETLENRLQERTGQLQEALAELQRSVSLLQTTLESTADAILAIDLNGNIVNFNQKFLELWHLSETKLSQVTDRQLSAFVEKQLLEPEVLLSYIQEEYIHPDLERTSLLNFKDGRIIERYSKPQYLGNKIIGRILTFRDITHRRKAEEALRESERRYATLAEASPVGLFRVDRHLNLFYVNERGLELIGFSAESVMGKDWVNIIHPNDRERVVTEWYRCIREQIPFHSEHRFLRLDGSILWVYVQGIAEKDETGEIIGYIGTITNISDRKFAEDKLRASEERYRSLVMATSQVVWISDPAGKTLHITQGWHNVTGQPLEVTQGDGWLEAVHPEDREGVRQGWDEAIATKTLYEREYRVLAPDGSDRHLIARGAPVFEIDGTVREWVGTCTDITERKLAEAEKRKANELYQTLSRNFPNGAVFLFDRNLRYTLAEGKGLAGIGLSKEQLEGKTIWESLLPIVCTQLAPLYRLALAGQEMVSEIYYHNQIYQLHTLPVRNEKGEIFAGMAVTQDINLHKNAEKTLRKSRDELEKIVQERTQELSELNANLIAEIAYRTETQKKLEAMTADLQRSNQELEQFAYVASHDLQEPLRAIIGCTQFLELEYKELLNDSTWEYLNFIVEGANRMQRLIQDLLSYARVGTQGQAFSLTDCQEVLQEVLENLEILIQEKNAKITYDPLPQIQADSHQIVQLFQNLIGNAIKFCQDRSPEVHISAMFQDREWLFSFRDNGIGIKPQYFDRIFVVFKRLHSRTEFEGTGIGLAICKKIVERHGGRIWVESEFGVGTIFYLTIPNPNPDEDPIGSTH